MKALLLTVCLILLAGCAMTPADLARRNCEYAAAYSLGYDVVSPGVWVPRPRVVDHPSVEPEVPVGEFIPGSRVAHMECLKARGD